MNTWPDETKEEDAFESCRTCSRKIAPYEKYCAWHAADEDEDRDLLNELQHQPTSTIEV